MAYEFLLPDVGEGLTEGEIVKWLVAVGDTVKADQNIVQVETDKAVADLPAPVGGTILAINFKEGEVVKVGEILCSIGDSGEKVSPSPSTSKTKEVAGAGKIPTPKKAPATGTELLTEDEVMEQVLQSAPMTGSAQTGKVLAAPAVRKRAAELKVDLATLNGTGENGRILMQDLEGGVRARTASAPAQHPVSGSPATIGVPQQTIPIGKKFDEYGAVDHMPLKGIRKTIAKHMIASLQNAAQLSTMEDVDVTALWKLRKKEKAGFEKRGVKLTFLPYVIKAAIAAMREVPIMNSQILDEEILIKKYFNVGIAVETEVGLMVPNIKNAEKKNIETLAREIMTLSEQARTRKIDVQAMKGGTFTITNYGSVGGTYGTPVLNPPEASIIGLGRIFDRAVLDKNGKLKNVKILPVSLTFDHQILDGAQAARFMNAFRQFLEDPAHLLSNM